ncbi:hypothetical protein EDC01DRAFT_640960 [Geopyxis carbonaria]|nr:hypothetical protein EDC01DRAFT_640960 [Geopyxis carbonaria]
MGSVFGVMWCGMSWATSFLLSKRRLLSVYDFEMLRWRDGGMVIHSWLFIFWFLISVCFFCFVSCFGWV